MSIQLCCLGCHNALTVDSYNTGAHITCPSCQAQMVVPRELGEPILEFPVPLRESGNHPSMPAGIPVELRETWSPSPWPLLSLRHLNGAPLDLRKAWSGPVWTWPNWCWSLPRWSRRLHWRQFLGTAVASLLLLEVAGAVALAVYVSFREGPTLAQTPEIAGKRPSAELASDAPPGNPTGPPKKEESAAPVLGIKPRPELAPVAIAKAGPPEMPAAEVALERERIEPRPQLDDAELRKQFLLQPLEADSRPKRIQVLLARLDDKNSRIRAQAIEELGNMGSAAKETVARLGMALHDLDADVRKKATRALAQIGPAAVGVLIEEVKNPACRQLAATVRGLAVIGPEATDAVGPLTDCLKHKDSHVRATTAYALGEIGPAAAKASTTLALLLDDPSAEVRKQAWTALAQVGAPALPGLQGALKSPKAGIRQAAADLIALMKTDAREAVPDLLPLLRDKHNAVRRSAALALGAIGKDARDAIGPLSDMTSDSDPSIRAVAAEALGDIGPEALPAVATLIHLFKDSMVPVRFQAARAIVKIGPSALNALINAIANENQSVRLSAIFTLGELGPDARDAVPLLLEQRKDFQPMIRSHVALALGKIGARAADRAVDTFKEWIKTEDDFAVRVSIRLTLVQLQPDNNRETMLDLSKEVHSFVVGGNQERLKAVMENVTGNQNRLTAAMENVVGNQVRLRAAVGNLVAQPRTPQEMQLQTQIQGVLNFYLYRNSFRFGDGLDKWSHAVLNGLGFEAIPAMVETLNLENAVGGKEGFVVGGIPVDEQPKGMPDSVFFH